MRKSTIYGLTAGLVLSAGIVYAAQNVASNLAAQADESSYVLSIDPANGSVVSDLSTITIKFNGRMGVNDQVSPAPAILENTTTGDFYYCHVPFPNRFDEEGNASYTLTFTEFMGNTPVSVTTPGNYTLTLRGFYTGELEDGNFIPVLTFNYTVGDYPVAYSLTPAVGSDVTDLSRVSLTFPNTMVAYYDQTRPAIATIENVETGDAWYCVEPNIELLNEPGQDPGVKYNFTFYEIGSDVVAKINTPGNYVLTVKGLYTGDENDTEDLPAITANYTIVYPVDFTLDPTPGEAAVKDLSKVTITFPAGANVGFLDVRPAVAMIENTVSGDTYFCETPEDNGFNENGERTYTFTFKEIGETEDAVVNLPGDYTLTIRGAYQTIIGEDGNTTDVDLPVITANYTIDYPVAYTVSPEGNVEEISEVTVAFAEGSNVGFYDVHPAVAVLENVATGEQYYGVPTRDVRAMAPTYNFKFTELGGTDDVTINQPGDYTLTIRGAYQTIVDEEGTTDVDLPVITVKYTIAYPVAYELNPVDGANVEDLSKVTLTFPNNIVAYYDQTRPAVATLENTTTGETYYCYEPQVEYMLEADQNGIEYYFTFYESGSDEVAKITAEGDYVLSIRGLYTGTLDEEGEITDTTDLPVITANYKIDYPVNYTLTPESGAKVEDLTRITLTFPTTMVAFYENTYPAVAVLENTTTGETYFCYEPQAEYLMENGMEGIEYYLSFYEAGSEEVAKITAVGEYVLSIRGLYTGTLDEEGEVAETTDLPVITANYSIEYPVEYTLNPESGASLTEISTITVTFEAGVNVGIGEFRPAPVVLENTTTGTVYYCLNPMFQGRDENGANTFAFTFTDLGSDEEVVITELGNYELSINGIYTSTIDENGIESAPTYLPTLTAKYTVDYPIEFTLNPEAGATVTDLSRITLTFPNNMVGYYENTTPAFAVLENTTTGDHYFCYEPHVEYLMEADQAGIEYILTFYEAGSDEVAAIVKEGEYTLSLHGLYTAAQDEEGEYGEPIDLPVLTAKYTVVYPVDYTLDPVDGNTVTNLSKVTLTFPNNLVAYYDNTYPAVAILENTTTGATYFCYEPQSEYLMEEGTEGIEFYFSFYEAGSDEVAVIDQEGEYVLSIRGLYTAEMDEEGEIAETINLPVITANYSITYPVVYEFTPAAGSEVEDLSTIVLTFPHDSLIGINDEVRPAAVVLENTTTDAIYVCENPMKSYGAEGEAIFTMTFSELGSSEAVAVNYDGAYVLTVKGLFKTEIIEDEEVNTELPNIVADFYIVNGAGVEAIFGETETSFNVYGINGIQVVRNGNAEALKSLRPGLYIINGKKVLVK